MGLSTALVVGTTACTDENSDTGKVVSITDGDTLVASVNGKDQTIRLLNIDTPETKDPNKPVECLGDEATAFLEEMLPVGTKIKLVYDVERTDKYDRTLAAVYAPDKSFVSAEIARAGLGTAVSFGKNTRFLPPVKEAEQEAKSSGRGIYDSAVECTIPGQLALADQALETMAAAESGATSAATGSVVTAIATAVTTAHALQAVLKAGRTGADVVRWAAFTEGELATQISSLSTSINKAETHAVSLKETQTGQAKAEAEAAAKKAAAEAKAKADAAAKKKAAEEKKAAEAAAKRAAEEAAAEAERIRNLPPVYVPPAPPVYPPPAYQPPAQDSGGGYPGYTGPRCYLPGGKSYRPC